MPRPPYVTARQCTPSDQVGILSNANVKIEERLDLVDFLDGIQDDGDGASVGSNLSGAAVIYARPSQQLGLGTASHAFHTPAYQLANELTLDAECEAALTLLEQVPRQLAWPLQALLCFCLPVVGVETSFRITQGMIEDRGPRATVDECLDVLTRREYLRRQTRGARSAHSS